MALQFDPSAYMQAFQMRRQAQEANTMAPFNSANQLAGTLSDIGNQMMQRRRQNLMNQLTQQQLTTAQMLNQPLIPDQPGQNPQSTAIDQSPTSMGATPQGSPSQGPQMAPDGSGWAPPMSTPSDSGWQAPISAPSATPIADAFHQMTGIPDPRKQAPQSNGMATPMFGQSQGQSQQPSLQDREKPFLDIIHNPSETPARQKLAMEAIQRITEEEKTPFEMAALQRQAPMAEAQLEETKAKTAESYATAKEKEAQAAFLGQTGGKIGEQKLKLQKQFNDENKDTISELKAAQTADGLTDSAKNNPVAYNALPLKLAKMLTGSSRINLQEIQAMGGSKAVLDRAEQIGKQMASGTITDENYKFMKGLTRVLIDGNKSELRNAGMRAAMQYSRVNSLPADVNYQNIVGEPYGQETFGASTSQGNNSQPQQIGRFKVTVQ